jgi:hypothetical protein
MLRRKTIFQANPLSSQQLAELVKANQLMSQGKPLQAGPMFAQVAQAMQTSNHPRRAANLYTRAAHAFADGNNGQQALAYSRAALTLFIQHKMPLRTQAFYRNITGKMRVRGMNLAAEALQSEYGAQVAAQSTAQAASQPRRGLLPTSCPKCGAPVHGDEITWVDDNTIECDYCGTLIRVE